MERRQKMSNTSQELTDDFLRHQLRLEVMAFNCKDLSVDGLPYLFNVGLMVSPPYKDDHDLAAYLWSVGLFFTPSLSVCLSLHIILYF